MSNNQLKFPQLITIPMRGTKTATILVMAGTGSKYESAAESGISHFLEHMFFKGTKKRPTAFAISSELDALGSDYNAFTAKEFTGYWIKVSADKIIKAAEIVGDMLLDSSFKQDEINREKGVIIEEVNMYLDNPMMRIEDVFENLLYGDTPAGRDTIGAKKNILGFKRQNFIDYFSSQYSPANIVICAAGNIGNESALKKSLMKIFSSPEFVARGKNFLEKDAVKEKQSEPRARVEYKKTDQAHLSLGVRTFPMRHKNESAVKLASIILGGSMSSRLFINLRERNGLAYYVHTGTEFYTDSGYLSTQAGVPVDKVEKAIKIILTEYGKLKKIPVGEAELKRVKDLLAGKLAIQVESSDNVANWYGRQAVLAKALARAGEAPDKTKIFTPEEYLRKIKEVSAADIKRAANEIFADARLNLAIIGPFKDGKRFEKIMKI